MRVTLQPAFILHSRPFNETSVLLEVFTLTHGRISLIARGARSAKSRLRGLLRPFIPLLASWSGKTELMSLNTVEATNSPFNLVGSALLSGLYLNELLVQLLPRFDHHPELFMIYQQTLQSLQQETSHELCLRKFEKELLAEMGYGLSLHQEAHTGEPILSEHNYNLVPGKGLVKNFGPQQPGFPGKSLLALHHDALVDREDFRTAKQLMRMAIAELLGSKVLRSRELFVR